MRCDRIVLIAHDSAWPAAFETERAGVQAALEWWLFDPPTTSFGSGSPARNRGLPPTAGWRSGVSGTGEGTTEVVGSEPSRRPTQQQR